MLHAQENVSPKSNFKDGVYEQAKQFFSNNPTQSTSAWMKLFTQSNSEQNIVKIGAQTIADFEQDGIDLNNAWGICLNKIPYIRLRDTAFYGKGDMVFVRLYVVGNLCYYYHKTESIQEVIMNIYNPLTQQQIGRKPIANRKKIMSQSVFRFGEDKILPFTETILSNYLKDDEKVYNTWKALPKPISQEQLFKLLLVYNDRNPIQFLPIE